MDRWVAWPRHTDPLFENYNPPSLTPRQRDHYYESRAAASDMLQFAVEDQRGEFVGRLSLREIDWGLHCAVLGVTFHPRRLGEGLGTDAMIALLKHYFGAMEMRTLFLDVAAFNRRALRCYQKCGFHETAQHWGDPQPDYAGIRTRREYAAIRSLFRYQDGFIRPLLIDMVLHRDDFLRLHPRGGAPGTGAAARAASR